MTELISQHIIARIGPLANNPARRVGYISWASVTQLVHQAALLGTVSQGWRVAGLFATSAAMQRAELDK